MPRSFRLGTDGAEGLPIDPISYHDFADAGVDEFTLVLDPARPAAVETLARAAEQARG